MEFYFKKKGMDFYSVIKRRRSIRNCEDRAVKEDKLERVLDAARTLSAVNVQPWRFIPGSTSRKSLDKIVKFV